MIQLTTNFFINIKKGGSSKRCFLDGIHTDKGRDGQTFVASISKLKGRDDQVFIFSTNIYSAELELKKENQC